MPSPDATTSSLQPITYRGIHRGMADEAVVGDALMPQTQMRKVVNMDTDAIGVLTRSKGYERLGGAAVISGNSILGMHHHTPTTTANRQIVAFVNDAADANAEAYYLDGTTWTNKDLDFTIDTKIRSVTFLNYLMAVNGTDAPKSWTGAAGDAWGTTNLASAPTGSLIETFRQQVYIGRTSDDSVFFSSIPSAGAITWNTTDDFFQVNPNDGSSLSALKRFGSELLIYKRNYLYRFNGRSTQPDPHVAVGAPSQEAVCVAGNAVWFFDETTRAIYGYAGGYPEPISKSVRAFLQAIPTSSFASVVLRGDEDHVEAYIGDVTVNGVTISKCAVRYTISTQTWTLRSYAHAMTASGTYDDGTSRYSLNGDSTGFVFKMDTGNKFYESDIPFEVETPYYVIGGVPAYQQTLAAFAAYCANSANMLVQYRVDSDMTWKDIGACREYVNSFSGINANFHRIKFRFTGTSNGGDPAIFEGFSMLLPIVRGIESDSQRFNV